MVIGTFASVFDFDVKTGAFYHKIGRQGNGHGEYNGKSGMYVYDGIVGINSENSRSINKYNLDGDFLGSVRYEVADKGTIPLELMALNDTCFISMNVFKGIPNKTPRFSLYTSDFKLIRDIEGFFVNSGYLRYDMVRSHGGRMFFANMFSPDVYLFDANSTQAELAYIVDFGKYTANPSDVNPDDEYESMQWYGKDDHLKYYSIVQGFYDDGKRIHFICMGGNGVNIVCYDKASKKSQITKIDVDEEKQRIEFNVLYGKDGIYMFVDNLEKPKLNPAVLRIPYDVVAVI